jgi:putative transposase
MGTTRCDKEEPVFGGADYQGATGGEAGAKVEQLCRRHGISRETYYRRKKFGGMGPPKARRLKQLEAENARLQRILADQALNLQVLNDLLGNES